MFPALAFPVLPLAAEPPVPRFDVCEYQADDGAEREAMELDAVGAAATSEPHAAARIAREIAARIVKNVNGCSRV